MSQWRRLPDPRSPPTARREGLIPQTPHDCLDDAAYSRADLRVRGWTDSLILKYLGDHDSLCPVNHWANYYGKHMYSQRRVIVAESHPELLSDLRKTFARRNLSPEHQQRIIEGLGLVDERPPRLATVTSDR
jgi:hypothetical protein